MVVRQQKDALDEEALHLRVIHYRQVHQDGAQDLRHLGRGGASPGSPALMDLLPSPCCTPLLLPKRTLGRLDLQHPFQRILWSLPGFYPIFRRGCAPGERASGLQPIVHLLTESSSTYSFLF